MNETDIHSTEFISCSSMVSEKKIDEFCHKKDTTIDLFLPKGEQKILWSKKLRIFFSDDFYVVKHSRQQIVCMFVHKIGHNSCTLKQLYFHCERHHSKIIPLQIGKLLRIGLPYCILIRIEREFEC